MACACKNKAKQTTESKTPQRTSNPLVNGTAGRRIADKRVIR